MWKGVTGLTAVPQDACFALLRLKEKETHCSLHLVLFLSSPLTPVASSLEAFPGITAAVTERASFNEINFCSAVFFLIVKVSRL